MLKPFGGPKLFDVLSTSLSDEAVMAIAEEVCTFARALSRAAAQDEAARMGAVVGAPDAA
jgi:hypothetical protein